MFKHIIPATLALGFLLSAVSFTSCKKEQDSVDVLMERNYPPRLYLQGDNYSAPTNSYSVTHSVKTGLAGHATGRFFVRLNRAVSSDVVVELKASIDKEELASSLVLSSTEVTIKAGNLASEEITVGFPDLEVLKERAAKETYHVSVQIASIKSAPAGVQLSTNQNLYSATIEKGGRSEDILSTTLNSLAERFDANERATKWRIFDISPGVENANKPGIILGGSSGDLATDNRGFSFSIDFGRVIERFAGVYVTYWGGNFAARGVMLEISTDGTTWTNLGTIAVPGRQNHSIGLDSPRPARYVRYTITRAPSRLSVTGFWALEMPDTSLTLPPTDDGSSSGLTPEEEAALEELLKGQGNTGAN